MLLKAASPYKMQFTQKSRKERKGKETRQDKEEENENFPPL